VLYLRNIKEGTIGPFSSLADLINYADEHEIDLNTGVVRNEGPYVDVRKYL